MTANKLLKFALVLVGLIFLVALVPMMHFFPDSWTWTPRQAEYEEMIAGVYATLGVFLLLAARNPMEHKSLIWFTAWSSLVHGAIMLSQAIRDPSEAANLHGDVPGLLLIAIILGVLMYRAQKEA